MNGDYNREVGASITAKIGPHNLMAFDKPKSSGLSATIRMAACGWVTL